MIRLSLVPWLAHKTPDHVRFWIENNPLGFLVGADSQGIDDDRRLPTIRMPTPERFGDRGEPGRAKSGYP